jgi:3-oxoacyl-[acyl-carrier protein] reductase
MEIQGKTALVAGATRGIGRAVARKLAACGARLVLPWFDWPEDAQAMRDEFSGTGQEHVFVRADLRDPSAVQDLAEAISGKCGVLHILVNNIERGGMPVVHGSYEKKINRDQWRLEMDTTLLAKRLVFEHCFPLMRGAAAGAVVNISSIAALTGRSGPAGLLFSDGYAAANRGVRTLTETWARMAAPRIRVNEIMLGLIDTRHGPHTRGWEALRGEEKSELLARTLLQRTGTPEEVAEMVLFLVRDASYMTGSVIRLDGGYVLGGEPVRVMPPGILEDDQ